MKYNINDLKIIVNDKILDDIRKYYCFIEIIYLNFDYPHKHYTFNHFKV